MLEFSVHNPRALFRKSLSNNSDFLNSAPEVVYGIHWYLTFEIRIRIYLLARRNLLWDILRLPSSRRAVLGLYVILTLWQGRGANQPPYALLHRSSPRYALRHGRRHLMFPQSALCILHWLLQCRQSTMLLTLVPIWQFPIPKHQMWNLCHHSTKWSTIPKKDCVFFLCQ